MRTDISDRVYSQGEDESGVEFTGLFPVFLQRDSELSWIFLSEPHGKAVQGVYGNDAESVPKNVRGAGIRYIMCVK